jgi:YegS/Rv2252/BmrU family lipid kinase
MTRAFVIGRKRKGRDNEETVRDVGLALEAAGWSVERTVVKRKRDLTVSVKAAVKRGHETFVVVGGDGAILRVAGALADRQAALGVVPTGTGNLLAGNLGIPRDVRDAVAIILAGHRRSIDLGRAKIGRQVFAFSVACGIGFDAEVMDRTDPGQKRRWGKLAYLANAISQTAGIANVDHDITIDGERTTTQAAQVLIANFGTLSLGVRPRRAVRPDDGLLDVIVVRASGPLGGLLAGWEALRQKDLGETPQGHVYRTQARQVRVKTKPRRLVEVDGSVVGRTPVSVNVLPAALTVIVPAP